MYSTDCMTHLDQEIRKTATSISLPEDLRDTLRALVADTDMSVSGLLRWGAMLAIEAMGFELPRSVAAFRRARYGGQMGWDRDKTESDFAILYFNDPAVYAALVQRAARHNGDVGEAAYEFMVAGIARETELEEPTRRGLN